MVHHNPCFNLFILHNNPFDNQGSEINKNDILYIYKPSVYVQTKRIKLKTSYFLRANFC